MTQQSISRTQNQQLKTSQECDKIQGKVDDKRKVEIFSQMIRHITAIVYLIAELVIGRKPEKL